MPQSSVMRHLEARVIGNGTKNPCAQGPLTLRCHEYQNQTAKSVTDLSQYSLQS